MGDTCCTHETHTHTILVAISEGKRLLGKPSLRWEDNIKKDLNEIGLDGTDRIHMFQDRGPCGKGNELSGE
jgi:hypothetical protein